MSIPGGQGRFGQNVAWNVLGNVGGKVLAPLFQLLIARLLVPEDYGAYALALAWLAIFEVVKDWGLSQSIIVRRGGSDAVAVQFTAQLVTAAAFFLITLVVTPFGVSLFAIDELAYVLPLTALVAFISAISDPIVTECLVEQQYRRIAMRQMLVPFASGAVGLLLASMNFGVYALVVGLVVGHAVGALALQLGRGRRHRILRNRNLFLEMMQMGKHIVMQRFFGFLVGNADSFVIGSVLGPQALGLYRMTHLLAFLVPGATVSQAQQVVFTELSKDPSPGHLKRRYDIFTIAGGSLLLMYSVTVYFAAPMMVPLVLGAQWADVVPLIQILGVVVITGFLTPLNIDFAKILGFVHVYTRFAAIRSLATILAVAWAAQDSVLHVVVAWVLVGMFATFVNDLIFFSNQKLVKPTKGKIIVTFISWGWAAFVIGSVI